MKVKFNDSDNFILLTGYVLYNDKVKLTAFGITENLSGFMLYEDDEKTIVRDCTGYKYKWNIYTEYENGIMLTKSETDREQKPISITLEQVAENLIDSKKNVILQSRLLLSEYLENNPLTFVSNTGKKGTYSVTQEKQALMMSQYMAYQIEKAVNPDAKLTWNEAGEVCEEWEEEDFLHLIMNVKAYVYPLVSYQQTLEKQINNCKSQNELDNIIINYQSITTNKE